MNKDLPLHDYAERENDGEDDSVGVGLDRLPERHVLLSLGCLGGIVNEGIVVLDLGGNGGCGLGIDSGDLVPVVGTHDQ